MTKGEDDIETDREGLKMGRNTAFELKDHSGDPKFLGSMRQSTRRRTQRVLFE
jgi:hypothetical protein